VAPGSAGKYLVTYRKSAADRYALYKFDPETRFSDRRFMLLPTMMCWMPLLSKKVSVQKSCRVKWTWCETGLLLCQDINILDPGFEISKKAGRIEVLGLNSSLGIITVEEDGSFYLKQWQTHPSGYQTLDENGKVLNGPCSWIWIRPNERRVALVATRTRAGSRKQCAPFGTKGSGDHTRACN